MRQIACAVCVGKRSARRASRGFGGRARTKAHCSEGHPPGRFVPRPSSTFGSLVCARRENLRLKPFTGRHPAAEQMGSDVERRAKINRIPWGYYLR